MLSTSIGSQVGGIQPSAKIQPPPTEDIPKAESSVPDKPAAVNSAQPLIPGNSGASISIEAITALQQVQEASTAETKNAARSAPQAANQDIPRQAGVNVNEGAETVQSERPVQQVTEDRYEARAEIALGEETDGAGRSVRNPLNLQI